MNITKKLAATVIGLSAIAMTGATLADNHRDKGRGTGPVVFVINQGLFYDSIVLTDLPKERGDFQQLFIDSHGPHHLATYAGPGNEGYRGGRWWVDANENGMQDQGDKYFLCPLLGPGRLEM